MNFLEWYKLQMISQEGRDNMNNYVSFKVIELLFKTFPQGELQAQTDYQCTLPILKK